MDAARKMSSGPHLSASKIMPVRERFEAHRSKYGSLWSSMAEAERRRQSGQGPPRDAGLHQLDGAAKDPPGELSAGTRLARERDTENELPHRNVDGNVGNQSTSPFRVPKTGLSKLSEFREESIADFPSVPQQTIPSLLPAILGGKSVSLRVPSAQCCEGFDCGESCANPILEDGADNVDDNDQRLDTGRDADVDAGCSLSSTGSGVENGGVKETFNAVGVIMAEGGGDSDDLEHDDLDSHEESISSGVSTVRYLSTNGTPSDASAETSSSSESSTDSTILTFDISGLNRAPPTNLSCVTSGPMKKPGLEADKGSKYRDGAASFCDSDSDSAASSIAQSLQGAEASVSSGGSTDVSFDISNLNIAGTSQQGDKSDESSSEEDSSAAKEMGETNSLGDEKKEEESFEAGLDGGNEQESLQEDDNSSTTSEEEWNDDGNSSSSGDESPKEKERTFNIIILSDDEEDEDESEHEEEEDDSDSSIDMCSGNQGLGEKRPSVPTVNLLSDSESSSETPKRTLVKGGRGSARPKIVSNRPAAKKIEVSKTPSRTTSKRVDTARTPAMCAAFARSRDKHKRAAFSEFNSRVFGNALSTVEVSWSKRLVTTAGITRLKRVGSLNDRRRVATIELSTKVIDDVERLRSTLLHEMCHAAAWLIDDVCKPPHGACFKKWAAISMRQINGIEVTTTHDYVISYKYAWTCTNNGCGAVLKRHSRSIDVEKQCCGRCKSALVEIEVPAQGQKVGFTPKVKRKATGFSLFVQKNSKTVREKLTKEMSGSGQKVAQSEVMKECGRLWREQKSTSTVGSSTTSRPSDDKENMDDIGQRLRDMSM